jgi:hypothetical protein
MLSPQVFAIQINNLSLEDLIKERNRLIEDIRIYEKEYLNTNNSELDEISLSLKYDMQPSADTNYYFNNMYLLEVNKLIVDRLERKI